MRDHGPGKLTLLDHRATSVKGAIAKLHRDFEGMVDEARGDDAMLDPGPQRFADRLAMASLYPHGLVGD